MRRVIASLLVLAGISTWVPTVLAQPIDTTRVHLGPADGGTDAFVAWPTGKAAAPGVVVVHEWWGLNAQIRAVAWRLAKEGYVAIVPDLYHGKMATDPEQAHVLSRGLEDPVAYGDLEAAASWLRGQPRLARKRIGVMGFCMGGGLALGLALRDSTISATEMFYGAPVNDPAQLASLRGPVQGHFGEKDDGIPPPKADSFRSALKQAGKEGEVYVYAGAGHAFMNETRPSYHADAARQAWARTLAFFQKNLKR